MDYAGEGNQGYHAHQDVNHLLNRKHIRLYSSESEQADKPQYPIRTPDHVYVYNGPLAVTVTRLKVNKCVLHATQPLISVSCRLCSLQKLSLFSCACTIAASPVIIYMSSASSFGAKASIALTLCGFGFFTTGEQGLTIVLLGLCGLIVMFTAKSCDTACWRQ